MRHHLHISRFSRRFTRLFLVTILLTLCAFAQETATSVPNLIRYGGTLKNVQGSASVAPTTVGVTFSIYKQQEGGSPVWQEVQNVTPDANGLYSVLLGSTTSTGLPDDLFAQQEQRWLTVQVQGQEEQARVLLVSVPYALKAHEADTLGGLPASAFMKAPTADSTGTVAAETGAAVAAVGNAAVAGTPSAVLGASGKSKAPCPPGTNHILYWDATNDICPSAITQDPGNGNIGIGLPSNVQASEPLDVQGVISTYTWYDINEKRIMSVGNTPPADDNSTNLFLGWNTGTSNNGVTNDNTFVGRDAGVANTTGHDNTFSGYQAGNATTGGNDPAASYNTFSGSQSGLFNKTGFLNTFTGYTAGYGNTTGAENSCFGSAACLHNLTGVQNVALGAGAGFRNMDGSANVYVGFDSGWGLSGTGSRGSNNTMTGWETGFDNFGSNNVFYGYKAGFSNTTGSSNIAIGAGAGSTAGSGNSNNIYLGNPGANETSPAIRIGIQGAPHVNQTYIAGIVTNLFPKNSGASVVLIDANGHLGVSGASLGGPVTGSCSLGANFLTKWSGNDTIGCTHIWETDSGTYFVGIGPGAIGAPSRQLEVDGDINVQKTVTEHYQVMGNTVLSIDGTNNLFTGVGAGTSSGSTTGNTFTGYNAGNVNTANGNSFYGFESGVANATGIQNVFVGYKSGLVNAAGHSNTFVGYNSGQANNSDYNTFLGTNSGFKSTASGNTFLGYSAGSNTTGDANNGYGNTATGYDAGRGNVNGTLNAYFGVNTGFCSDTNPEIGSYNTYLGNGAGSSCSMVSGSNNIFLGFSAGNAENDVSNSIEIGNSGANHYGDGSIQIGTLGGQINQTYVQGIFTYPTPNVNTFVTVQANGHLGMSTVATGGGNVTGNCTLGANFLARWTNSSGDINCSHIWETQSGTYFVGINTTSPGAQLDVNGDINAADDRGSYQIGLNTVLTAFGDRNTILGYTGAHTSNTGQQNTFLGANAGQVNAGGDWNVFVGSASGASNVGGYENVFVGQTAGRDNVNGHDNTYLGEFAGTVSNPDGSYNTYVGEGTGQSNTNGSSNIYLMNLGASESNTIRIGTQGAGQGQQNAAYVAGIYNSSVGATNATVCIDSTGKLGTVGCPSMAPTQQQQIALESQQKDVQTLLARVAAQQQQIDSLKTQLVVQNAAFQERLARMESLLNAQVATADTPSLAAVAANGGTN